MKKIYLLLLALVGIAVTSSGQGLSEPWFGLRAGVNFSNLSSPNYSTGYLTGFSVGAAYHYPISTIMPIYLQSGLYFQQKGAQDNGFLIDNGGVSRLTSYEFQVPLLVGCQIAVAPEWNLQAAVGLYYSVAVDGRFEVDGVGFDPYNKELLQTLRDSTPVEQQLLQRSDFGVRFEVSALYHDYLFGFTFDGGLLNGYTRSFRDAGYQALSGCFTLFLGYNF